LNVSESKDVTMDWAALAAEVARHLAGVPGFVEAEAVEDWEPRADRRAYGVTFRATARTLDGLLGTPLAWIKLGGQIWCYVQEHQVRRRALAEWFRTRPGVRFDVDADTAAAILRWGLSLAVCMEDPDREFGPMREHVKAYKETRLLSVKICLGGYRDDGKLVVSLYEGFDSTPVAGFGAPLPTDRAGFAALGLLPEKEVTCE
jgi:hypothetical protein